VLRLDGGILVGLVSHSSWLFGFSAAAASSRSGQTPRPFANGYTVANTIVKPTFCIPQTRFNMQPSESTNQQVQFIK
jgi:hypothetical protein